MVSLVLNKHSFPQTHASVNITENTTINIETTFNFSVNYVEDNSQCQAVLKYYSKCKEDPTILDVGVEVIGTFSCDGILSDEDKQLAHVQAYGMLFPLAQLKISNLFVDAGLPPFNIQMTKLDPEKVTVT